MRIVFTAGGTGGHIFPIIAVARQLKTISAGAETLEMFFVGPDDGYKETLAKEGIIVKTILAGKLRRYFSFWALWDILKTPIGLVQALWRLYLIMPDVVFSKGGYGSVWPVFAAWFYRIPILSQESDAVPGLANRIGAIFSQRIAFSFKLSEEYFPAKKAALTGNPVRSEIIQICLSPDLEIKAKAQEFFGVTGQKPVILVVGGSQGADKINQLLISILPEILDKYDVIHQCGVKNHAETKESTKEMPANYHLFPFLDEEQLAVAYLLSNLVISRAGAGSIFEIAACGKPSILIPIPQSASDHQRKNAFEYARAGAASVLEQDNVAPHLLLNEIREILTDSAKAQKMSENARNFSQPSAADQIARALVEMASA